MGGGFRGYLELLRMRVLWPIIPLTMVAYAPAATIRGLWAGPYLTDSFAVDALTIGSVTFFMALAMVAGSFVYGPLDTLLRTRKWIAFGGNVLNLAALTGLVLMPTPQFLTASILLVAIGFFGMTYGVLMAHASAFLPPHLTGRGVTLMNFFSMGGAGLVQFATGPIFDRASEAGTVVAGYHAIFVFYAVLLAIGLLLYLPARDAPPAAGA
jgi:sugar phosphate permease